MGSEFEMTEKAPLTNNSTQDLVEPKNPQSQLLDSIDVQENRQINQQPMPNTERSNVRESVLDDADVDELEARRTVEELQEFIASPAFEDAREQSIFRLQQELRWAMQELRDKDQKCERLSTMQQKVDTEIHELTTSLFHEAYIMVNEAKTKQARAENMLKEANDNIEVLRSELTCLKKKLSCSPPSNAPLSRKGSTPLQDDRRFSFAAGFSPFRRGTEPQPLSPALSEPLESEQEKEEKKLLEFKEIDPVYHRELVSWREKHDLEDKSQPFFKHIYFEEVKPCLNFANSELGAQILSAVEGNAIVIEEVVGEKLVAKICELSMVPRICPFRFKLSESSEQWFYISQLARNRIAATCDFFTYLRYLSQGLIKCGVHDSYWDVIRLRKNMALARLGLGFLLQKL